MRKFVKILSWFFVLWAAAMVLLQAASLLINGASRETLTVVSELLVFAWFGLIYFFRRPFARVIKIIPRPGWRFVIVGYLSTVVAELVYMFSKPIHPVVGWDLLLTAPWYLLWLIFWFALLRKYNYTLTEAFILGGFHGFIIEGLLNNPLLAFVGLPLFIVLYGAFFIIPYLLMKPDFTEQQPASLGKKIRLSFVPLIAFIIGAIWILALVKIFGLTLHASDWPAIRKNDIAQVSSEWQEPKLLPFNTAGWQEGNYISPDGQTFYFGYINVDAFRLRLGDGQLKKIGPSLDDQKTCLLGALGNWNCGDYPRYDLFYVEKTSGGWSEPRPHSLTLNCPVQSITLVNENKAYFVTSFDDHCREKDIAYSEKINGAWQPAKKIEAVSSVYWDDDPYVNQADNEMFFWSQRPAKFQGHNIYRSVKANGAWQAPELLPPPINSAGDDLQTFVYGDYLYFVSNRQPTGKPMGIYRSKIMGGNQWGEPEMVVSSKFAVGEPSLPADGGRLYFEQIFTDGQGNFKAEMLFAERK